MESDREHSSSRRPSPRRPRSPTKEASKKNTKRTKNRPRSRSRSRSAEHYRYRDRYHRDSNRRSRSRSRDRVQDKYWFERHYGVTFRRERSRSRPTSTREIRPSLCREVASSSRRNRSRTRSPLRINHREEIDKIDTKRVEKISYDSNTVLGKGSFSYVYRGILELNNNNESRINERPLAVAVKRLQYSTKKEANTIQREIELMQKTSDHPNILRYICTEKNIDFVLIATELCSGTLEDYVKGNYQGPRFLNEKEILRQVTQGLAHLHRKGIVHRDIKPTNILIFVRDQGSETEEPLIKLADFGISKALNADREDYTNTSVTNPNGTKGWMAPEVYQSKRFTSKVDIFPLGCIFAYTLTGGKHPFGEEPEERISRITGKHPMILIQDDLKEPYYSASVLELIKDMLEIEPLNRPKAEDVLRSPFFMIVDGTNLTTVFSKLLTHEFLELCISFETSLTDKKVFRFKELIKDERVDVKALKRRHGRRPEMDSLAFMLLSSSDHPNLIELVQLLIRRGRNVDSEVSQFDYFKRRSKSSPLHYLCDNRKLSDQSKIGLVQLLLENGADVNVRNDTGMPPLHYFCAHSENGNLGDILQLLIQNGGDVNTRVGTSILERSPLLALCQRLIKGNIIDPVRVLIQNGADVNARLKYGKETPLHLLCRHQEENEQLINVIQLLLESGANFKGDPDTDSTPLHELSKNYRKDGLMDIVKLMIENGADINASDKTGMTPLTILRNRGFYV